MKVSTLAEQVSNIPHYVMFHFQRNVNWKGSLNQFFINFVIKKRSLLQGYQTIELIMKVSSENRKKSASITNILVERFK